MVRHDHEFSFFDFRFSYNNLSLTLSRLPLKVFETCVNTEALKGMQMLKTPNDIYN